MLSSERAMALMFERDGEKRDGMVDRLSEADAKTLLKIMLKVNREQLDKGSEEITGL